MTPNSLRDTFFQFVEKRTSLKWPWNRKRPFLLSLLLNFGNVFPHSPHFLPSSASFFSNLRSRQDASQLGRDHSEVRINPLRPMVHFWHRYPAENNQRIQGGLLGHITPLSNLWSHLIPLISRFKAGHLEGVPQPDSLGDVPTITMVINHVSKSWGDPYQVATKMLSIGFWVMDLYGWQTKVNQPGTPNNQLKMDGNGDFQPFPM